MSDLIETLEKVVYVECPFCHEPDFDLIGLKTHFTRGYCDVFEAIDEECNPIRTLETKGPHDV